jgi:hypothetical protein
MEDTSGHTMNFGVIIQNVHDNDVLFGRGNHAKNHPGNRRYRALVAGHKDEYLFTHDDKQIIGERIFEFITSLQPPGRFLRENQVHQWEEVSKKDALKKICQALRETNTNQVNTDSPKSAQVNDVVSFVHRCEHSCLTFSMYCLNRYLDYSPIKDLCSSKCSSNCLSEK